MNFTNIIKRFPKVCAFYWNSHWRKGTIMFTTESGAQVTDVRNILKTPAGHELAELANQLSKPTSDETALECLNWVHQHIKYYPDSVRHNKAEKWQTADETLKLKTGDCEDMSILWIKLCELAGVPNWRRKIACGDAKDPFGQIVGHAYGLYLTDDFVWTSLDAAYYPLQSIANFGKPHSELVNYRKIWFTFNETYSWHQKSTTIFMY